MLTMMITVKSLKTATSCGCDTSCTSHWSDRLAFFYYSSKKKMKQFSFWAGQSHFELRKKILTQKCDKNTIKAALKAKWNLTYIINCNIICLIMYFIWQLVEEYSLVKKVWKDKETPLMSKSIWFHSEEMSFFRLFLFNTAQKVKETFTLHYSSLFKYKML